MIGMAYPCGGINNDERVADIIRQNTGIKYARTIISNYDFSEQNNLFQFNPTVHLTEVDKLFELGSQFLEVDCSEPMLFYIWGHSYELDLCDLWQRFESFCELISGHEEIFYWTNKEILLKSLRKDDSLWI